METELEGRKHLHETIAKICHEANRAYCQSLGDDSQQSWFRAPDWQKESALLGVKLHLSQDVGPEASHEAWSKVKYAEGWVYGIEKNAVKKTHPCLVPFNQLPAAQQLKDVLFRNIVHAFKNGVTK